MARVGDRALDVAHDRALQIATLFRDELDDLHRRRLIAAGMNHERGARLLLRLDRGAHDFLFVLRPRPRVADLPDEAGPHARVPDADRDLADDLAGDGVFAPAIHVGRVRRRHVIAGAHDDVEAGGPCDPRQGERVARQAHIGGIHDGLPAGVPEEHDLVARGLLVEQAEVVEVRVEVLSHPADVREAHRLVGEALVARGRRFPEHDGEIDEQVLVGQRDAQRGSVDGAEYGQRFA